jgi:hypothetical protein
MTQPLVTSVWEQRARNTNSPMWIRLYAVAEHLATPTGHAPARGHQQIRLVLGDDTLTGSAISRAISDAIKQGWLHQASSARCLLLPWATRDLDCPAGHRSRSHR